MFQLDISSNYGNIGFAFWYLGEMFPTSFPNIKMESLNLD